MNMEQQRRETMQVKGWRAMKESGKTFAAASQLFRRERVCCILGAAFSLSAWHHLLMGHRLTCYLSRLPSTSPLKGSGSYQCALVADVNNYIKELHSIVVK